MTKQDFIKKWNVAFEDKEQEAQFAAEMEADLDEMSKEVKKKIKELCNAITDLHPSIAADNPKQLRVYNAHHSLIQTINT